MGRYLLAIGLFLGVHSSLQAVIQPVPAGQGVLPPVSGALVPIEKVLRAFQKNSDEAIAEFQGNIRIKAPILSFNADHALNIEHDLFVILTPDNTPWKLFVRISREQLKALCLPDDKRPMSSNPHYAAYDRTMSQYNTDAYFDRDLDCIALHYSEVMTPHEQMAKVPPKHAVSNASKDVFVSFSVDKVPLLSVNDTFDGEVVFEKLGGENTIVFVSTAVPYRPPLD